MSFTLPRVFRLENNNNKNNLEKKIKSLSFIPPPPRHFSYLPRMFAIRLVGCRPRKGCLHRLWPSLQQDGEKEVGKGSRSMAASSAWPQ